MKLTFGRVIDVVLVMAIVYAAIMFRPASSRRPELPRVTAGETLPALAVAPYAQARRTVVLYVRSSCHFCTASMDFYRELAQEGRRIVVVDNESAQILDAYLSDNHLAVPRASVTRADFPKFVATPTLVVVDAKGTVVNAWIGQLNAEQQQAVRLSLD